MAAARTTFFTGVSSPLFRSEPPQLLRKLNTVRIQRLSPRFAISINRAPATFVTAEKETTAEVKREEERSTAEAEAETETEKRWEEKEKDQRRSGWKEYLEQAKELIGDGGGPPRWFSPLDCGSRRLDNSPLMLFLPGIDGTGLGLIAHHQKLGRIFDLRCLHIPAADRTPFTDLVKLVERTVRSEYERSPNRPIYLVGESLGGCLALAVAARNRDIDLVLILANPATSFSRSQLQLLTPLLEALPGSLSLALPNSLSLTAGEPLRMLLDNFVKGLPLQNTTREQIIRDFTTFSSSLPVLADILPKETLLWKLKMSKSASEYANSRLYAIKAQTLILCSGNDQLLPSQQEGERLYKLITNSELRKFDDSGHFLLLDGSIDLVTVLKGTSYYRRGKYLDYVSDFIPPTPYEAKEVIESHSLITAVTSAVMLSTLEDGTIVKGLAGIPSEGPVLFVGYHMLLGLELVPLVTRIFNERNILVRGIAHPMMFIRRQKHGRLPEKSTFDTFRIMGAVPVAPTNLFKLLSSKSHVLLYPGGMREALHRKGEEYKLFWPEESEFIRMAARFGAKIVPFGAVGEDDLGQVVIDYDDYVKIPYLKSEIESLTNEAVQLRAGVDSEVANQQVYLPGILPKIPGRFYYYFGKPIETAGRKQELKDREKSQELYFEVKSEVEKCIDYLKEKRESDPYRSILPRLLYQATHGFTSDIPTFEI